MQRVDFKTPASAIRFFMQRKNMKQADLSRATGIADSIISRLLKGKTIGPKLMEKICQALGLKDEESALVKDLMIILRAESRVTNIMKDRKSDLKKYGIIQRTDPMSEDAWKIIKTVAEKVEESCQKNNLIISPAKKSEIIVSVAKECIKVGMQPSLEKDILKMVANAE